MLKLGLTQFYVSVVTGIFLSDNFKPTKAGTGSNPGVKIDGYFILSA
jgi:hypothetical protein